MTPQAVEILSASSVRRDHGVKRQLYEALGVPEYWICDVGGVRRKGSPVAMEVFRQGADGLHAAVSASGPANGTAAVSDIPAYRSAVCGVHVRLTVGAYEPRFQWWDAEQGRWRDTETEAQGEKDRIRREAETIGKARGEAKAAIAALHTFRGSALNLQLRERIEERWHADGPPEDVMDRILTVQQTPSRWRVLLLPDKLDDNDDGVRQSPRG